MKTLQWTLALILLVMFCAILMLLVESLYLDKQVTELQQAVKTEHRQMLRLTDPPVVRDREINESLGKPYAPDIWLKGAGDVN